MPNSPFLSFLVLKTEVFLLTTSGRPLDINVSSTINTENDIWYTPRPSAPTRRERNILNTNPSRRVRIEKEASTANALNKFFKCFSPN